MAQQQTQSFASNNEKQNTSQIMAPMLLSDTDKHFRVANALKPMPSNSHNPLQEYSGFSGTNQTASNASIPKINNVPMPQVQMPVATSDPGM